MTGARDRLARQLRDALATVGFLVVVNHGVPQTMIDAVFAQAARVRALPMAQKQALSMGAGSVGYLAAATYAVKTPGCMNAQGINAQGINARGSTGINVPGINVAGINAEGINAGGSTRGGRAVKSDAGKKPDSNEAFFIDRDRSPDDPAVRAGKRFREENKWPDGLPGFAVGDGLLRSAGGVRQRTAAGVRRGTRSAGELV